MHIGVSTACLYPMETERSLDTLLSLGFRRFELFLNCFSEVKEDYVRSLREKLDASGAQALSVHPFTSAFENMLFFSDYARRTEDGLTLYRDYFRAANLLGASILVLHGQRNYHHSSLTDEEYCRRYQRLFWLGQEYGITVAQENVNAFRSEKASFIRRMRDILGDECAFVLDLKQAVRAGEQPFDMLDAMKGKLVHLHLNDHTLQKDCLLPGQGHFDWNRYFQEVADSGYAGEGVIEVYRGDFARVEELLASKKLLESCLGEKTR